MESISFKQSKITENTFISSQSQPRFCNSAAQQVRPRNADKFYQKMYGGNWARGLVVQGDFTPVEKPAKVSNSRNSEMQARMQKWTVT